MGSLVAKSLQWRHNECDGVSNHRRFDCLFNRLFRRRSKETSKLRITGLCEGNSPVTGEFPAQRPVTRKIFPFDDVIMRSGCIPVNYGLAHTTCITTMHELLWRYEVHKLLAGGRTELIETDTDGLVQICNIVSAKVLGCWNVIVKRRRRHESEHVIFGVTVHLHQISWHCWIMI